MNLEQKINYLEKKFNAPMDIIMQVINHCEKIGVGVDEIKLNIKINQDCIIKVLYICNIKQKH